MFIYSNYLRLLCLLTVIELAGCKQAPTQTDMIEWTSLADLPGIGVSAPFAGLHSSKLIVAGGCNFPDKPVTEGGEKKYYDTIFVLDTATGFSSDWVQAGTLPYPVAYGASVSTSEGLICIGGNNSDKSLSHVLCLRWNETDKKVDVAMLPDLPVVMDNLAAAAIGKKIYAAGGNANGKASNVFYCLDTERLEKGWEELPPFPGPSRIQPVIITQHTPEGMQLFIAGGFQPVEEDAEAVVSANMLSYHLETKKWQEAGPILPFEDGSARTLTGGCGIALGDSNLLFAGGVNYEIFSNALNRELQKRKAKEEGNQSLVDKLTEDGRSYMHHPATWYKFNQTLLLYNTYTKEWKSLGDYEQAARAGAGIIFNQNRLIIINGELKPGIRTPQVNKARIL